MTTPSSALPSWERRWFQQTGEHPAFVYYVVFGAFEGAPAISRSRYRCAGVPEGLDMERCGPQDEGRSPAIFRQGPLWETLQREDPALAEAIAAQNSCVVLRGEFADGPTLDALRDVIGIATSLLDQGGVALYDPLMFRWWAPDAWREQAFAPDPIQPHRHVAILTSPQDDGRTWFHTRGLRKFARPDLGMHDVDADQQPAVIELFNRFIELQALGGLIEEGREIRMAGLPEGLRCRHAGHLDDPDYNNVHVEIEPA